MATLEADAAGADLAAASDGEAQPADTAQPGSPDPAADFGTTMQSLTQDMQQLSADVVQFQATLIRPQKEDEIGNPTAQELEDISWLEDLRYHEGGWHHAVLNDWRELAVAPMRVRQNRELVLQAIRQDYQALQSATRDLRADRHFVLQAVKVQGLSLQYASELLRQDRTVVEAAINQDRMALRFASEDLRADPDLIRQAMSAGETWTRGGHALHCEARVLNTDEASCRKAVDAMDPAKWRVKVGRDHQKLALAPPSIKADRDVVRDAIRNSWGEALQYAAEELRGDKELVLEAVNMDGRVLQYATDLIRADHAVVMAAVQQTWVSLQFATEGPRSDREIVRAGIRQGAGVLQYASTELCADRDLMLEAVEIDGHALKYASAELRADRGLVLKAVRQTWEAFKYAHADLHTDPDISRLASKPSTCFDVSDWYPSKDQQLVRQQARRDDLKQSEVPPRGSPMWPAHANELAVEEFYGTQRRKRKEQRAATDGKGAAVANADATTSPIPPDSDNVAKPGAEP